MGDVISTHLDESKRQMITAHTEAVLTEFGRGFEEQYAVALFNSVRFQIEGGGATQSQLLHRKDPLENRSIFSGSLFQYQEENKKWRNRFVYVADTYNISFYEKRAAHERGLHPRATLSCAGYKALSSLDQYLELVNSSLPGVKAKASRSPLVRCATQYPLLLWHPYARHHCFCVLTEREHRKWFAVLQDCVRHSNNGLSEECRVQTPAFTDAVRLYRQARGRYGTWDMMCGEPAQILANLVMETLQPELRDLIGPRLKGKLQQRQRSWMLISEAVYRQVLVQTQARYEAVLEACEVRRGGLDAALRTDMDQIISSKEHVSGKIRTLVLPRAEQLLRGSVQPYIPSILDVLMEPAGRGFAEVRDVFTRELLEVSKNALNGGGRERLAEHMEKMSMLAFHPVKMQSCYAEVERLNMEGLQQRFDVPSPSVFVQRAQILMREQMDNAVYTFEQLLQQSLEVQEGQDLCRAAQRCQDRVLKKYDYDSSTVRKKFFREALLQIIIPFMLKQLSPSCAPELPRFQEFIFEDFSRFLLVENVFEEVVLQSVSKDIMMAVKEAAVQRRHNLYRDSMVLTSSDPNLHLLGESASSSVDWAAQLGVATGGGEPEGAGASGGGGGGSGRRRRQVVSMIQLDGMAPLPYESCLEVPGVALIPEEGEEEEEGAGPEEGAESPEEGAGSPDSVREIRELIDPLVVEEVESAPVSPEEEVAAAGLADDGTTQPGGGTFALGDGEEEEEGEEEEVTLVTTVVVEEVHRKPPGGRKEVAERLVGGWREEAGGGDGEGSGEGEAAGENAREEQEVEREAEEGGERIAECAADSDAELAAAPLADSDPRRHDDSGFQSPTNEGLDESEARPIADVVREALVAEECLEQADAGTPHSGPEDPEDPEDGTDVVFEI